MLEVDLFGEQFGTPGAELISASGGTFAFEKSFFEKYKSNSLVNMLSYTDHMDSYSIQGGVKYTYLYGSMYDRTGKLKKIWSMHLWGFGLGVGLSASPSEGKVDWGKRSKMNEADSINRANKLNKEFGGQFDDYKNYNL